MGGAHHLRRLWTVGATNWHWSLLHLRQVHRHSSQRSVLLIMGIHHHLHWAMRWPTHLAWERWATVRDIGRCRHRRRLFFGGLIYRFLAVHATMTLEIATPGERFTTL